MTARLGNREASLFLGSRPITPPAPQQKVYDRPAGWETWPVKRALGTTTVDFMETISGNGGNLRVELPNDRFIPPIRVQNFTNLVIIGGGVRALPVSFVAGQAQRMIYLPEIFGVAYFEGMHLDATNVIGAETDGFAFNGPTGTLRIRGCRITGLRGTQDGNHADLLQCWNGLQELDVDGLTGSSDYQGIKVQLAPNEKARGRKVNLVNLWRVNIRNLVDAEREGIPATKGAHHLWFDPEPGPQGGPRVKLRYVYSEGPQRLGFRLWPREDQPDRYGCTVVNGRATWPPEMKIDGYVQDGPPPGGDFVPAAVCGLNGPAEGMYAPARPQYPPKAGGTKQLGKDPYELRKFSTKGLGTVIKGKEIAASKVLIEDGEIDGVYRVFDMVDNRCSIDDFVFRRIYATGVKGGFSRIRRASNGLFEDCVAIGLGAPANQVDDFPSGFVASDLPTDHITYLRCYAEGFWSENNATKTYDSCDGFGDEEQDTFMAYIDCKSIDNADGGIDTKSQGVLILRHYSKGNWRNYRMWGNGKLTDVVSESPRSAHMWAGGGDRLGDYRIERPKFIGGSDKPHLQVDSGTAGVTITVVDPKVPPGETFRVVQKDSGKLVKVNVVYTQA